jgi:hypothetical protein
MGQSEGDDSAIEEAFKVSSRLKDQTIFGLNYDINMRADDTTLVAIL